MAAIISAAGCGSGAGVASAAGGAAPQLSPASLALTAGASARVTAVFNGAPPRGVAWSASGGSLSPSGDVFQTSYTAGAIAGDYAIQLLAGGSVLAQASVTIEAAATPPPPAVPPAPLRLFPNALANWLYSAPTGDGMDISSMTSGLGFGVNAHDGGFDFPVQYADGGNGCVNFTDTLVYGFTDHWCVPVPSDGFAPSVGGWDANDGHLVVVNGATGDFYDFWRLSVNASGQPISTNVGAVFHGNLASSNGAPGTTAAFLSGLAGDILPGELSCATCLNHALSVIVPATMNSPQVGTQAPAAKTDGSVWGAVFREGAKIRFDPSIDVSSLGASTAAKAILRALQLFGGAISDQTGANGISFYSALATAPDLTGLNQAGQHLLIYY